MFDHFFTQTTSVLGTVGKLDVSSSSRPWFVLRARSGDEFRIEMGETTSFQTLTNLDGVNRDRYGRPEGFQDTPANLAQLYLREGMLISVEGIYQRHAGQSASRAA